MANTSKPASLVRQKTYPRLDALHRWLGLGLAFFLLIQALTGLLMVYPSTTMQWQNPALYKLPQARTGEASFEKTMSALSTALTAQDTVITVIMPKVNDFPVMAIVSSELGKPPSIVVIDPDKGVVTGRTPIFSNIGVMANFIHQTLFIGMAGTVILAITGLGLMLLAITGIIRWWPSHGSLGSQLQMRWAGSLSLTLWRWHKLVGALLFVVFGVIGFTGAMIVARSAMEKPISAVMQLQIWPDISPSQQPLQPAPETRPVSELASLEKTARAVMKGDYLVAAMPQSAVQRTHNFIFEDSLYRKGLVQVDGGTGKIVNRYHPADVPTGSRLLDWMYPLHTGSWLPSVMAGLWYVFAVALILLAISGIVINRRRARLRKQALAR